MTDHAFVRMRRPNGLECVLRVSEDRLQSLMNTANDHFGTSKELIGGPRLMKKQATA